MDGGHKVRPTLWSMPLFLAVPRVILETVEIVRCSLLHSLWRFLTRWGSESSPRLSLD
jgi:hypothetical protein